MADEIRRVDYFYLSVPDKPGEAARVLATLRDAGVNLLVFSGFPEARRAQLDFVPEDSAAFLQAAKKAKLAISKKKIGFLVQGEDRPGAVAEFMGRLAEAGINVTAGTAIAAGAGRFGAILWVKPPDLRKAAKALGVT